MERGVDEDEDEGVADEEKISFFITLIPGRHSAKQKAYSFESRSYRA
jgi:hypothetical protein